MTEYMFILKNIFPGFLAFKHGKHLHSQNIFPENQDYTVTTYDVRVCPAQRESLPIRCSQLGNKQPAVLRDISATGPGTNPYEGPLH